MKQFCIIISSINILLYAYFIFKSSKSRMINDLEEIEGYKKLLGEDSIHELIKNMAMMLVVIQIFYLSFVMLLFYKYTIFKYITFIMILFVVITGFRNFLYPNKLIKNKITTKYFIYNISVNIIFLFYNLFVFWAITSLNFT